jgi:hypothetical protein
MFLENWMNQQEPETGSYFIFLGVSTGQQISDHPKLQVSDVSFSFAAGVAIGRAWAGAPGAPGAPVAWSALFFWKFQNPYWMIRSGINSTLDSWISRLVAGLEHGFYDFPKIWEWNNHPN